MKKVELLAPAGSFQALQAAIAAGCDAVYLGGSGFGARAYAKNFTNEQMVEAIKYAHLHSVNIYVTLNTLIYDNEFSEVIKYVNFLYNNDVDAIIVQDLGLMKYVISHYPDLEIHASTQMTIHNLEAIQFLEENHVKRVVLARENNIDDINIINQSTSVETEVFVHGALCICYSGQCLMSSLIGGRSGNRGRCAQPCRKLYDLSYGDKIIEHSKYMLSPKDLNTLENIGQIIETGVHSLKIEGRMKSPEYVAIVVSLYRKAIEQYYKAGKVSISNHDLNDLAQIFNRQFTKGFIFHAYGNDYINLTKNNNTGVAIGVVIPGKNNFVNILLSQDLRISDGINFEDTSFGMKVTKILKGNKEVVEAFANEVISLQVKTSIPKGVTVFKTTDHNLLEKAKEISSITQLIPLEASIDLHVNKKPRLTLVDLDGNKVVEEIDFKIEKSKSTPISLVKIRTQLNKLGNTPFYLKELTVNKDDDIFIVIGILNQLRRNTIKKMIERRENKYQRKKQSIEYQFKQPRNQLIEKEISLSIYCRTLQQVKAAKVCKIQTIYVEEEIYSQLDHTPDLYCATSRINYHPKNYEGTRFLVSEIGDLPKLKHNEVVSNVNLNVTNSETINLLKEYGVNRITLSYEMNDRAYKKLAVEDKSQLEIIAYGYQEAMLTKHCFFSSNCQKQCLNGIHTLTDEKKEKFLTFMDKDCQMHILNSKKLILSKELSTLHSYGYNHFRLQFTIEDYHETIQVIDAYKKFIYQNISQDLLILMEQNKQKALFTRGYFNKNIL